MQRKVFSTFLVLLSVLTLVTALGFTSTASAHSVSARSEYHQTHAVKPSIYSCGFDNGNYDVDVDSTTSGNHYFCGPGYTGMYVTNVFNVYNNGPWTVWIRWYQPGQFCYIRPQDEAQWGGKVVLVTQLEIEAQQGGQCPAY
jgi:hypothetical protein